MSFKDILSKLDQLSEATKETSTGRIHKGSYGTSHQPDEKRDEYGHKLRGSKEGPDVDSDDDKPAVKRGRGRPQKGADSSGEVKKYDSSALSAAFGGGKKPSKAVGTVSKKHSLKEYFDDLDKSLNEADQLTIEPAKQNTQVIKQGTKTLGTVSNPQLAAQIKQSIGKGEMSLAGSEIGEASTGDYSAKKARAGKDIGKPGKNFAAIAKSAAERYGSAEKGKKVAGAVLAKLRAKTNEADIPPQDGLLGAGLGAGRSQGTFESKNMNENINSKLKAAHHAGKSHALSKQSYNGSSYDDVEEARSYHEGFKEGLDECYGQVPIQGLTVADEGAQSTVDDMASFGAHTPSLDEEELEEVGRGEWLKQQAKKPGDTFKAFGQTFHDKDVVENNSFFESLDNQLNSLLEEYDSIQEGISVSVSKGQQGAPDSVSVTAQDADADKLLALVKSAGLGLFGDETHADVGVPAGNDQHGGIDVVGDHDGMLALIKKATGSETPGTLEPASAEDYADEEGSEDEGGLDAIKKLTQTLSGDEDSEETDEATCNECGAYESQCGCAHDKEVVDEVESEDQQTYEVAEDNPPDSGAEEFAEIDAETAEDNEAASSHGGAQNSNLEEEGEEAHLEEDDEEEDEEDLEESYANSDDDGFEADIDFMTKVISGGLNKQKSTGQTTIPVIAGQNDREGYSVQESVSDWKKLAGLK